VLGDGVVAQVAVHAEVLHVLAVHVEPFESKGLKPGRFQTLWVNNNWIQLVTFFGSGLKPGAFNRYESTTGLNMYTGPHLEAVVAGAEAHVARVVKVNRQRVPIRDVALQVAFERQISKPVFHLIGVGLWV
jgi:hypothetical protein